MYASKKTRSRTKTKTKERKKMESLIRHEEERKKEILKIKQRQKTAHIGVKMGDSS